MKKVYALIGVVLFALLSFGCDMGNSGGSNPAVGSLTITLNDPSGDVTYGEGVTPSPYAVVTGTSAGGTTFQKQVTFDSSPVSLTIENLAAGEWAIKIEVWDDLSSDDSTDEEVIADFYDTVEITDGNVTALNPTLTVIDQEETQSAGSLTLTLNDPSGDVTYGDGVTPSPYAVVTGTSADGTTFQKQVSFDSSSLSLTFEDLAVGEWLIKIEVWDDLSSDDSTDEEVVAAAYGIAEITEGNVTALTPTFYIINVPVNPTEPVETLAVGSLTLTLEEPDVDVYDDGVPARAEISGASANGATFTETVTFDSSTESLVIDNLLVGDWNIKVKVWDNLNDDDLTDGISEDVTAIAYGKETITDGDNIPFSPVLYTGDDVNALLNSVYDSYDISSYDSDTDTCPRTILTKLLWIPIAYDETIISDKIDTIESEGVNVSEAVYDLFVFASELASPAGILNEITIALGENVPDTSITYLDFFNIYLDKSTWTEDNYLALYTDAISQLQSTIIGDYEFLFYDILDVTLESSTDGFTAGATLPDVTAVDFTASADYDSLSGFSYTWYLNGEEVESGASYSMDPADCLDGLNYLSVELSYGAGTTSVILGSDSVVFYSENSEERLLIEDIDFASTQLMNIVKATGATYADEVTALTVRNYSGIDLEGIQYLINLQALNLINLGLTDESDIAPILQLTNLTSLIVAINPLTDSAIQLLEDTFPDIDIVY